MMKFCIGTWQKMSHKQKNQLTDRAQKFFHLIEHLFSFVRIKKDSFMNILILENQIQDLTSPNCGRFQLYFYKKLV